MRLRLVFPILTSAALFACSASCVQAGSFLGPTCYGSDYAYQYPNRAHNVFGCGPGRHCQAWHPFFRRGLGHRNRCGPKRGMPDNAMSGNGMPMNGMPMNGMPMNGMPMNGMPMQGMQANGMTMEYLPTPLVQSPMQTAPVHMTSTPIAPVPALPAVQSRSTHLPAPMPLGPSSAEPPAVDASGKPPF